MRTLSINNTARRAGRFLLKGGLFAFLILNMGPAVEAAAPARTSAPYAESICSSNPDVFFCEDFEGNDIRISDTVGDPGKHWLNPAVNSVDLYWTSGGSKQHSTQPLPGFSANNRVYRISKAQSFTDIDTGINTGTGDGSLKGTLKSGLAGTGAKDWYARLQVWFSADTIFPADYDMKIFFAQSMNCIDNPSCTFQTGIQLAEDFNCSGLGNFSDVLSIRYGPPYDGWPISNEYCPPLAAGLAPDGIHAPRLQKGRWYTLEYHVKLSSSPSSNNGMLELWVDGIRAYSKTLNTCPGGCPDMGTIMILNWMHSGFPADPQGGYVEYDNVVMSRRYIGLPGNSAPPSQTPATPTGVSVTP